MDTQNSLIAPHDTQATLAMHLWIIRTKSDLAIPISYQIIDLADLACLLVQFIPINVSFQIHPVVWTEIDRENVPLSGIWTYIVS